MWYCHFICCVWKHRSMFGGSFFGFGGNKQRQQDTPRGADIVLDLQVTLEDLYDGQFFEVSHLGEISVEAFSVLSVFLIKENCSNFNNHPIEHRLIINCFIFSVIHESK